MIRLSARACLCAVAVAALVSHGHCASERMAAWHETMVATDEDRPNSLVSTYVKDRFTYMDSYTLAKLVAGAAVDGKSMWPAEADGIEVEDIPGGVVAQYALGNVTVRTELMPVMVGRDSPDHDGAAVYFVSTEPAVPVTVRCGGGGVHAVVKTPRVVYLRDDSVGADGDGAALSGAVATLSSKARPLSVAVTSSGDLSVAKTEAGGEFLDVRFESGAGWIVVAFAEDETRAKEIATLDAGTARQAVNDYYHKLLQCRILTPEKVMDQAFASALYNLEYNWLAPYGWMECINHWFALWHMQMTGAAEWIGQADRSRMCNVTTAENLLPSGAAPQFMPNGTTRKDFGGSNQFFAWQTRHYYRFTGDRQALATLGPALDRVIGQTFEEYDLSGNGLLAWGQQIGNQEDYVSTPSDGTSPSVEGINMLKTAAELARAQGEGEKARAYERRAGEVLARLRAELWQRDLGRFAFYRDATGVVLPDGQYHTLIYPVIWGLLDPLESYTSIRHLRDRLSGPNGEVYCSNNFPNHVGGTWGMQAGAAQQPWAAWALAAVGLRNETYRPLKAVAEWVMDANHRGSWPEIAREPCPAYFSPPAGLFVQSTIEALFGLRVNKPEKSLEIRPSFPDTWPSAKLELPDYSATFTREGNRLTYTVGSRSALARRLRWMLPPCEVTRVTVNGNNSDYQLEPGVGCVTLAVDTPAGRTTTFEITCAPVNYAIEHLGSVAEGDELQVRTVGCTIESIADPCGVLSGMNVVSNSKATLRIATGLLRSYLRFGRLGQMNFSRKTFFLKCRTRGGVRFHAPMDITVLPRHECAATGEVTPADGHAVVPIVVRNNASARLKGTAWLNAAQTKFEFDVDVGPRNQREYRIVVPLNVVALLSPGDNRASVVLPSADEIELTLVLSRAFGSSAELAAYARSRIRHIPIPGEATIEDTKWRDLRGFYAYGHWPWAGSKPPLEASADKQQLRAADLPAVSFRIDGRRFVPVSRKLGRPEFTVDLDSRDCKKIYVLLIPFLDNHNVFSRVGKLTVTTANGGVVSRDLFFPGDLDWWCPEQVVGEFATARRASGDRFELLPLLRTEDDDWRQAGPPEFPQPEFWSTSRVVKTASSVMCVVEIDLKSSMPVESLTIRCFGQDASLGIVAISVETGGGQENLRGTKWMPPLGLREPRTLFSLRTEADVAGWRLEGEAFSVARVPQLFDAMTLNSLAKSGETATGTAVSPDFSLAQDDAVLEFTCQGGNSQASEGPGSLRIDLMDAANDEVLETMQIRGSHLLRKERMQVARWQGRNVRLRLVDHSSDTSYAWLGLRDVRARAQ